MKNLNRKIFLIFLVCFMLGIFGTASADKHHKGSGKSQYVIEEAERRNIKLISSEEAKNIARKHVSDENLIFEEVKLRNEAKDYYNGTDFRPVYEIECFNKKEEFEFDIDASTGQILKFERELH